MQAMILAAGRGERMRPLTDNCPKPLLQVAGQTLIGRLIRQLTDAGVERLVINASYLAGQLQDHLGDGRRYGVPIHWSLEPDQPLETAGGIIQALPLLGEQPFWVVNADLWTDYPFSDLTLGDDQQAHLVLVTNPDHHPSGDFGLAQGQVLDDESSARYTFAGISLMHSALFAGLAPGRRALAPVLRQAIRNRQVGGELYQGLWRDIGTPKRLRALEDQERG